MRAVVVLTITASGAGWFLYKKLGSGVQPSAARSERTPSHNLKHKVPPRDEPLRPDDWPWRDEPVNRRRLYDFYAKQAQAAMRQNPRPAELAEFPGLDDGRDGHWGIQHENDWRDDRWNRMELGGVMAGVLCDDKIIVPKAVCVQLGENGELSACIDPANKLAVADLWKGGFVKFAKDRFGLMDGMFTSGERLPVDGIEPAAKDGSFRYHGYYRFGSRVVFSFRDNETEMLASPQVRDGKFEWMRCRAGESPLSEWTKGGVPRWTERLHTRGIRGRDERPYVIDTITLPEKNPWGALMFLGGHDFFSNGDAAICTLMGDVWIARGIDDRLDDIIWTRFATGLHQPLGLKIVNDEIYVLGRDQITRLHDLNGDGEADFYECVSNSQASSIFSHDYITGLERGADGAFYFASGNQGICRVLPGEDKVTVLATGLRNPDGITLGPAGEVVCAAQEGDWTPASMICQIVNGAHYGYPGPKPGSSGHAQPLCFLPRGVDHSSGGQAFVDSDRWGPLQGQLLHFSYGDCTHFLVLRQNIDGLTQGMAIPLPGEFRSGAHRGRFNPRDGQLYVSGTKGWNTYATADGCFQRVRHTGRPVILPVAFEARENGLLLTFSQPLEKRVAEDASRYFAQQWNYHYGPAYGSPELSARSPGRRGHDVLEILSAHLLDDGRKLFLEIPQLQPVDQLHLHIEGLPLLASDCFATILRTGAPFTEYKGYNPVAKIPLPSRDNEFVPPKPNPWQTPLSGERVVTLRAASGFKFEPRLLEVAAGEPLALVFENMDAVPHNFVVLQPGSVPRVGKAANLLIADPDSQANHYIPDMPDIIVHTSLVNPSGSQTIHFRAPANPGVYPCICTFPGHWQVMQGELMVK